MERDEPPRRRFPPALLLLAMLMVVPVAPLVLRGMTTIMTSLGVVLEFYPATAVLASAFFLPRILGSLWAYFKVDDLWGNEVAYMAFFMWFPLIAFIFYGVTAQSLRRAPRGYEWATIKDGMVHQPIFEYVGPQAPTSPSPVPAGPQGPTPTAPQYPQQQYPQQYPQQQQQHQQQHQQQYQQQQHQQQQYQQQQYQQQQYPQQQHQQQQHQQQHQQQQYQQQQPYPPPGYYPQPYTPPEWAMHMYGQDPYGARLPAPTAFPQAQSPYQYQTPRPREWGPGPEWKKVREEVVQKRDYLLWHNVVLLVINAMMLASFVLALILFPFIFSLDGINETDIVDISSNPGFVLFSLIIQDGILIWMVWHQVVRRRVIPLTEMGISRATLGDSTKMARYTGWGIVTGLALFGIALLIELGQVAIGFAPPDDAIVVGPERSDLAGYLMWLVSACLIAPVSEEFFFRGYAFYAFNKKYGLFVALFASALGFSAIHGSIYSLLPIFAAGVGLALAYHRTGSLVPSMVAHAVNNFIAVTIMYLGM